MGHNFLGNFSYSSFLFFLPSRRRNASPSLRSAHALGGIGTGKSKSAGEGKGTGKSRG